MAEMLVDRMGGSGRQRRGVAPKVALAALVASAAVTTSPDPVAAAHPAGCVEAPVAGTSWQQNCYVGYGYDTNGGYVRTIQSAMQATAFYGGCADGAFGSSTNASVKSYQAAGGLTNDGIVGPSTWLRFARELVFRDFAFNNEYYSFGPWDPSYRHRKDFSTPERYNYSYSNSCGSSGWTKMVL